MDPRYLRPTEVPSLLGDASKARRKLRWKPRIGFKALVREMARADLDEARRDQHDRKGGFRTRRGTE